MVRRAWSLLAVVPLLVLPALPHTQTLASWTDREFVSRSVGAASADCASDQLYATTGRGRFLAGTVSGASLDPVAALTGIQVDNSGSGAAATPGSTGLGTNAYRSPVAASAIDGAISASVQARLPLTWSTSGTGAYTQYAEADSTGFSAGAAGAVTNAGAIDSAGIASGTQPSVGTLDVSEVLRTAAGGAAALPGLRDVKLTIGAVAATASLDQCALLWGASRAAALTRTYRVSSLSLALIDAATATLLDAATTQSANVSAALSPTSSTVVGASSSIASSSGTSLVSAVTAGLGTSGLVSPTATLASSTATVTADVAPVTAALGETVSDSTGAVTLHAATGTVTIDLGALQVLDGMPANTSVLSSAAIAKIETALVSVLQAHVAHVQSAWTAALNGAQIRVRTAVTVAATVSLVRLNVASVSVDYSGTLAQFLGGTETTPTPSVTALGALSVTGLTAALTPVLMRSSYSSPVEAVVRSALHAPLSATVATAATALTNATSTAVAAVPVEVDPLGSVLALTANQQPDAAPFPRSYAGPLASGTWVETALQVGIRVGGAEVLGLFLASASVGSNHTLNAR